MNELFDNDLQYLCCCTWGDIGNAILLIIAISASIAIIRKLFKK